MLQYTYEQTDAIFLPKLLEDFEDKITGVLIDVYCNGDSVMTAYTGTRLQTFIENIKEYIDRIDDKISLTNFVYIIAAEDKENRDVSIKHLRDRESNENEYIEEIVIYTTNSDFPMFKNSRIVKLRIPDEVADEYKREPEETEEETVEEVEEKIEFVEAVNKDLSTQIVNAFDEKRQKLLDGIQEIVDKAFGKGRRKISMNTILRTSMYFDNVDSKVNIGSFFTEVEIKFKVNIQPSVRENITTVGKLVNFLIERVGNR
jgi:acyl carrier protein